MSSFCIKKSDGQVQSKKVEKQIEQDAKVAKNDLKILILGSGESGKSTILKQFRFFHQHHFSQEEEAANINVLRNNIVDTVMAIMTGFEKDNIPFDQELKGKVISLKQVVDLVFTPEQIQGLKTFANDEKVKEAVANKHAEYDLDDSAVYYFKNLERILDPSFKPTSEDYLHLRLRTSGICETIIKTPKNTMKFIDVGGQRSERKKWFNCFDNVTVILYVVSLSEYNQMLKEDPTVSRIVESMKVFKQCLNNVHLCKCPVIIFFNKRDLFYEKLDKYPLSQYVETFQGTTKEEAIEHIRGNYISLLESPENRMIYYYLTCATDTNQMSNVIAVVNDIILAKNMTKLGLS